MSSVDQAEREAFAAIGELGRREIDAVKAWVASGCEGPKPQPDHAVRARLNERLKEALGRIVQKDQLGNQNCTVSSQ